MTQVSKHTGVAGPELVRLLARLAQTVGQAGPPRSESAFDLQLSQWLGWTDAVALAAGLDVAVAARSPAGATEPADGWLAQAARVRSDVVGAISRHGQSAVKRPRVPLDGRAGVRAAGIGINDDPADFSAQRQHIRQQQESMEAAVSGLRSGLRAALASHSVPMAKLAAVDCVIEQALVLPMQSLTSAVPRLLERYFRHVQLPTSAASVPSNAPPAWLNAYLKEQEKVLLAELDFRFQPIEGLMAALQSATHGAPLATLEPT
jgi:hypothetical protein